MLTFIGQSYPLVGLCFFVYLMGFAYIKGWEVEGPGTHIIACAMMAVLWPLTLYEIMARLYGRP